MNEWKKAEQVYMGGVEGLFREGEEAIAKSVYWSWIYAKYNLRGRFIQGEMAIRKHEDRMYWESYIDFLKSKGIEI